MDKGLIEGLKLGLLVEHHIGGELHLHEAPMITGAEALLDGAELFRPSIQPVVELFGIQSIRHRLGTLGIVDGQKRIVRHRKRYACFGQLPGKPVVSIEIGL